MAISLLFGGSCGDSEGLVHYHFGHPLVSERSGMEPVLGGVGVEEGLGVERREHVHMGGEVYHAHAPYGGSLLYGIYVFVEIQAYPVLEEFIGLEVVVGEVEGAPVQRGEDDDGGSGEGLLE